MKAQDDARSLPIRLADAVKSAVPQRAGQRIRVAQARLFEAFGSKRYSSPGLRGLDQKVFQYLPTEPGVFLEIGANDGFSQSNTYYLERVLGWRGVLRRSASTTSCIGGRPPLRSRILR